MRWALALRRTLISLACGALTLHLVDVLQREQVLSRSSGDMRLHARLLLQNAEPVPECAADAAERVPVEAATIRLMQAITIVERHATTYLERALEAVIVGMADALRLPPPDLSIGPGQLKPSTVLAALDGGLPGTGVAEESRLSLARSLLDACTNFRVGMQIIAWIARSNGISLADPDAEEIQTIARQYNGGSRALDTSDVDRALAVQLYGALVYHLYQELTFRMLVRTREE